MPDVTSVEHRIKAGQVRDWLATIRDNEDLVSVGAYVAGSNPRIDAAFARREAIRAFLCQPADTHVRLADAITRAVGALTMPRVPLPRGGGARAAAQGRGERRGRHGPGGGRICWGRRGRCRSPRLQLARAQHDAMTCTAAGADISTIIWHRNWIVGCTATVERRRREADARRVAFRHAEAQWQRARARHLALERLRERAWRRFRYEEHRQDIKAMDEVARVRYVLGRTGDTS